MTKAAPDRALMAILSLDAEEPSTNGRGGDPQRLPTLDQRVDMFLRAVNGPRDFALQERADARDRILAAMASDIAGETRAGNLHPTSTFGGAAAVPVREIRPGGLSWLREFLAPPLLAFAGLTARPRMMMATALAALLVLGAAWSGAWFYSARKVETAFAAWSDGEAGTGQLFRCGSRSLGGYPLRIELHCDAPQVTFSTGHAAIVLRARGLLAVASVFSPNVVTTTLAGPLSIAGPNETPTFVANWAQAQARVLGAPDAALERASLLLDDVRFERVTQANVETLAKADHLELQAQFPHGVIAATTLDIDARLSGGSIPGGPAITSRPFVAALSGVLHSVDGLLSPTSLDLRQWQAEGGHLEIRSARIEQGEAVAVAQGDIGLSTKGHLKGALRVTINDSERFAQLLRDHGARNETGFDRVAQWLAPNRLAFTTRAPSGAPERTARSVLPNPEAAPARPPDLGSSVAPPKPRPPSAGDKSLGVPVGFSDEGIFVGPILLGQVPPLLN